jgi:hypothetical protein
MVSKKYNQMIHEFDSPGNDYSRRMQNRSVNAALAAFFAETLRYSVPPSYRRQRPARRPKLDACVGTIDHILKDDKAHGKKQRHTAKRIFERLRDENAYTGGYTIVKDYERLGPAISTSSWAAWGARRRVPGTRSASMTTSYRNSDSHSIVGTEAASCALHSVA